MALVGAGVTFTAEESARLLRAWQQVSAHVPRADHPQLFGPVVDELRALADAAALQRERCADDELRARLVSIPEASRLTGIPAETLRYRARTHAIYGEKRDDGSWLVELPPSLPAGKDHSGGRA
jgi:hypothetical protein